MELIEPKKFEKDIISSLANNLTSIAFDPEQLEVYIGLFARDAEFDPAIQQGGPELMEKTLKLAMHTGHVLVKALKFYVGENVPADDPTRRAILSQYWITKEEFGRQYQTDYDNQSDNKRLDIHLLFMSALIKRRMINHLLQEVQKIKEFPETTAGKLFAQRGAFYPFTQHPYIFGMPAVHNLLSEVTRERVALLNGIAGTEVTKIVQMDRDQFIQSIFAPEVQFGLRMPLKRFRPVEVKPH